MKRPCLLYTAIFANSLNFKAKVTTERDLAAAEKLKSFTNLPDNWIQQYYEEVENEVLSDFEKGITGDRKILANGWAISQIELYNAQKLLNNEDCIATLNRCMNEHEHWLLTIPSISEGVNYLVSNSSEIKNTLSERIGATWNGQNGKLDKIHLRKEIIHSAIQK